MTPNPLLIENMLLVWNSLLNWAINFWNFLTNFGLGFVAVLIVISIFINTLEYIRGGDSGQSDTYINKTKGIKY